MTTHSSTWADRQVRHFWRLGLGVLALFLVTQVVALAGWVPHLRPVTFGELSSNILFAIGFGCPLVLHLSSLPRWRETLLSGVVGFGLAILLLALWATRHGVSVDQLRAMPEVLGAHLITGLGLASLGALGLGAWRNTGAARTTSLLFLLPAVASLIFTLEVGIFFKLNSSIMPETCDSFAYVADAGFGFQPSFVVGRLFAALPALKLLCFVIYVAPPPILIFVYALQVRAPRPPPVDGVTVLLFLGLAGYCLYFLCPVAGPRFAFGESFPGGPPPLDGYLASRMAVPFEMPDGQPVPRDGIPSLHIASVILAYWHARPLGRAARGVAAVFVVGTLLATLGLGEHYLVDLVMAVPFTLAVQAACTPTVAAGRHKWAALAGGVSLLSLWYVLLLRAQTFLLLSPVVTWALAIGTVVSVTFWEWNLAPQAKEDEPKIAPGPRGSFLLGNLLEFRKDVLQLLLTSQRDFGDVVRFRLGPMVVHLVSHPDHISHVLLTCRDHYNKDTRSSAKIRSITGEGLLTSNGAFWLRQRRLMQPAFSPQRLACFTDVMTQSTAQMLQRWSREAKAGRPVDVASQMMALTFTIVGKALFGADLGGEADTVERCSTVILEHTWGRLERLIELPGWFPTPGRRRFRQALQALDKIVHRLIAERRRDGSGSNDLLALLLERCDEETQQRMTDDQLRNETLTLLLAGHETTANALTWTWYLLSKHPEVRRRLIAEIEEVLAGRVPAADTLPRLSYAAMVFKESMRLYPPIWIMERRALSEDMIAGYVIPAGSSVVVSPYVLHRDPRFWENPELFDPERFAPEATEKRNPHCYIPFGLGQRLCIGNHFALMEWQIIIAMTLQAFQLDLVPGHPVEPKPGITLRPRRGLPMTLVPRG
jgi:cytochrome P450